MNDEKMIERMNIFNEFLKSELSIYGKINRLKVIQNRNNFNAVMKLYECADKNWDYLNNILNTGEKYLVQSIKYFMEVLGIDDFDSLTKSAASVKRKANYLLSLQKEGPKSLSKWEFRSLRKLKKDIQYKNKRTKPYLIAIMSFFASGCTEDFTPKNLLLELLQNMNHDKLGEVYELLLLTLDPKQYRKNSESESEIESESEPEELDIESESESENIDENTAKLLEQIDNLKAETRGLYIRLNSLEDNYSLLQNEGRESAVNEVLALLNSKESGMLIDQFAKCENTLRQLNSKGIKVPAEFSSLSLCVKIFMKTMRNIFGITQVNEAGEFLNINLDEAENYDYNGSDFIDHEEIKKVEVIAPGWKRNEEIFSLPKVIECWE